MHPRSGRSRGRRSSPGLLRLVTVRDRCQRSTKRDKGRIPDEFTAVTGPYSKHAIRLLTKSNDQREHQPLLAVRRIYDEAVREAVIVVWEASGRICGRRLKAAHPHLVESIKKMRGAPRAPATGLRGQGTAAHRQRSHLGQAAEDHSVLRWQPSPSGPSEVPGTPGASTGLQRLEQAPTGLPEDRPVGPLRRFAEAKEQLPQHRATLDPVASPACHSRSPGCLVAVSSPDHGDPGPSGEPENSSCPNCPPCGSKVKLPYSRSPNQGARHWRTRRDPFEGCGRSSWDVGEETPTSPPGQFRLGCTPTTPDNRQAVLNCR